MTEFGEWRDRREKTLAVPSAESGGFRAWREKKYGTDGGKVRSAETEVPAETDVLPAQRREERLAAMDARDTGVLAAANSVGDSGVSTHSSGSFGKEETSGSTHSSGSFAAKPLEPLSDKLLDILSRPDYLEKSRYVPTRTGRSGYAFREVQLGDYSNTGYDDPTYEYVNGNTDAINGVFLRESTDGSTAMGTDSRYLTQLTPEEKGAYNYIHTAEGKTAAETFLEELRTELNARQRAEESEYWTKEAGKSGLDAARLSALSVFLTPVEALSYLGQIQDHWNGVPLDPNAGYNRYVNTVGDIRGAVRGQIRDSGKLGGVGAYAYDLGMSVADFLYAAAVTGMSEPLTLTVMGTRAAADSVAASKRMGRSDERSIITGTLAGLVEAGTESIGFDALFGTNVRNLGKAGFRSYLLRNAGAEGSEEGLSDAVNWAIDDLYDLVTGTRESEFQHMVSEYERQGSAHPTLAAIGQRAKELGLDMLGGALSGLFLSGANAALNLGLDTQTDSTPVDVWEFLEPEKKRELDVEAALFPELQEKLDGAVKTQADTKTAAPDGTADDAQKVVVFSGSSALTSNKGLAYTLATNIGKIKNMLAVAELTGREMKSESSSASEQIRSFFSRIGNAVFREGFGKVLFNEYGVGGILTHRPLNRAKMVSLTAVPQVIQNGRLIQETDNWKDRGYKSFVFAAPVEIAGKRVYVAAVVDRRPDNKFYLNEVVDSDGNYVRIKEVPADDTKSGITVQTD